MCKKNYAFGDPKILSVPKKDVVSFPLNYSDLLWPSIEKGVPQKLPLLQIMTSTIESKWTGKWKSGTKPPKNHDF